MAEDTPAIDQTDLASLREEWAKQKEQEDKIAAEQDAALQAVKEQCDAFRAALQSTEE